MKNCNKCGIEITPELVVYVYAGYKKNSCKDCTRKQSRELNRKKARALKNWW